MCNSNTILSREQKECLKIINTKNNKSTRDTTKSDSFEKNGMAKMIGMFIKPIRKIIR